MAASSGDANAGHEEPGHRRDTEHLSGGELHEVELGSYNVTRFNPGTNTTLAIDFEVYATVLADEVAEFEHRFERSKARIREQITLTMHGAQSSDLTDAGWG